MYIHCTLPMIYIIYLIFNFNKRLTEIKSIVMRNLDGYSLKKRQHESANKRNALPCAP